MVDTPNPGETAQPVQVSNEVTPVAAPVTDTSNADVEAAKKQAQQAEMRANQLQNELDKAKAEQEAAKTKQLEEKEEYKTLFEQERAKNQAIEDERKAAEQKAELDQAAQDVLKDYPANVVELAKTTGLSLSDDSEASVTLFKEKLDAIKKQVGPVTASASNPYNPTPADASRTELVGRMRGDNVDVSRKAATEYIHNHPAVQRMREIAQNGA